MRKGYKFEHEIDKVLDFAGKLGLHSHKNHPCRTVNGTYIKGEPFDYEIFMPDSVEVFDAKEVKGGIWHMKDKDVRQCNELAKCRKNSGCNAYFLLLFDGREVKAVDVAKVVEILQSGHRSIGRESGEEWSLPERLRKISCEKQTSCQS